MTQWLLGTLLATSALIAVVLMVREPVRHHFGSRVAYGLWLIPAARAIMPTLTETVERPADLHPSLMPAITTPKFGLFEQIGSSETLLVAIWAMGALALFLMRIIQFQRQRSAILAPAAEIDRSGSIRVIRSAAVSGPVAFGILDRVIAVPVDFEARYREQERRLALDHEFSHHRSGDLIANIFALVLLCLQWFNPLAWAAHAAFRFDQEAACDERVLDKGSNRFDYGRAIAKAASGRTLLFAGALDRSSSLHRRLKCLLCNSSASQRRSGRLLIFTAVVLALPLTATRAINYIDVTSTHELSPAAAARSVRTIPEIASTSGLPAQLRARKGDTEKSAGSVPELARAEPKDARLETREAAEAREQQEQRNADQAKRDQEQRSSDQAQQDEDQLKRDADEAQRDEEQLKRDADEAQRDEEQLKRNTDQAQRDEEQLKRNAEQSPRDHE